MLSGDGTGAGRCSRKGGGGEADAGKAEVERRRLKGGG
jgi:hypothetical protein